MNHVEKVNQKDSAFSVHFSFQNVWQTIDKTLVGMQIKFLKARLPFSDAEERKILIWLHISKKSAY